jgi:hypothetical protein
MAVNTNNENPLLSDKDVVQRIIDHIDNATTDMGSNT